MKSFLLALPLADNAGKTLDKTHFAFAKLALTIAGGYTKRPTGEGAWQDPESGTVYYDRMVPYVFACEPDVFARVVALAFDLFPDQLALFTQELGEVTILSRPAGRQPDKATRRRQS